MNKTGDLEHSPANELGEVLGLDEEILRTRSSQIDRDDYSRQESYDAADEPHSASIDDLGYPKAYGYEINYEAGHPSPPGSCVESSPKYEPKNPECHNNDCESKWS